MRRPLAPMPMGQKGQSGNPKERPKGSLNATTRACEALLNGQAEALTQTAIRMGLGRDPVAAPALSRTFPLRPINSSRDAADVMSDVMNALVRARSRLAMRRKGGRLCRQGVRSRQLC
jgi:hypothetical protein